VKIANRVIHVFRNFGLVTSLSELQNAKSGDASEALLGWRVEHEIQENTWVPIVNPTPKADDPVPHSTDDAFPDNFLDIGRWREIEEGLQGNLEPPPEREFGANCIQNLYVRNYRAAVIEAIIGLEIVLAVYLREVLPSRGLTKSETEMALQPTITLSFRLSVLLRLVLSQSDLQSANLGEVLRVVDWRNHIIHRRGNLPPGLPEKDIKTAVKAVLSLVQLLALRRDELRASPELRRIANELAERFGVPVPTFWYGLHHHRIAFFRVVTLPPQHQLDEMILHVRTTLDQLDIFFRAEEHLTVVFRGLLGNVLAKWSGGKWSAALSENT
jgi:hypothetical protein